MSKKLRIELINLLFIVIGSLLIAIGIRIFLLPAEVATGGTPGVAMIIHFISGLSTGKAMVFINMPLLILASRFGDIPFVIRSVFCMLLTASFIDSLEHFIQFPDISSMLLSTLYGGCVVGLGAGLVLKGNASAGGTMIIARIVSHFSHIKPAKTILIVDSIIIVAIGIIFADMEKVLWSVLSIYATTQVIDKVITGGVNEKIIHIASRHADKLGNAIAEKFARDGTILNGKNLTLQADKSILFVVLSARRIPRLRSLVLDIDPQAMMVVMEATEMTNLAKRDQS